MFSAFWNMNRFLKETRENSSSKIFPPRIQENISSKLQTVQNASAPSALVERVVRPLVALIDHLWLLRLKNRHIHSNLKKAAYDLTTVSWFLYICPSRKSATTFWAKFTIVMSNRTKNGSAILTRGTPGFATLSMPIKKWKTFCASD